jgi:hypothetical protein
MAKTIGQLTQATTLAGADEFVIEQSGLTKRVAASVVRGGLVNADIDAAAAIAGSKLADGGVTPAKLSQPLTLATAQNSTSGTSIDFTGIPSWAKRVTALFNSVSTNGSDYIVVRLGTSGGIVSTNYYSTTGANTSANVSSSVNYTSGFGIQSGAAGNSLIGQYIITNVSGNSWIASGTFAGNTSNTIFAVGRIDLASALTQLRVTTTGGTDTFDNGVVNIMYEG